MAKAQANIVISAKDRTGAALGAVRRRLNRLTRQVSLARASFIALAGVAGVGLLVKNSFKLNDSLAKTADKLGVTTESLGGLKHAAALTGVKFQVLDKGIQNMVRNIADFKTGTGEAADAFRLLGLNAADLAAQKPDEQFSTIAEALRNVKSNTDQVNIAYRIFGGRATALLNTLRLGKDGLAAVTKEARALGVALTRIEAAKIEMANDAITRAKSAFQGAANTIAINLAPMLQALATAFTEAAIASNGFKGEIVSGIESVGRAIAFVGDIIRGIQIAFKGLQLIGALAIDSIIQRIFLLDRAWTIIQNKIASSGLGKKLGIQATALNEEIKQLAGGSALLVRALQGELQALVDKPMPSKNFEEWWAKVKVVSQKAAEQIAAQRAKAQGQSDNKGGGNSAVDEAALEKLRLKYRTELEVEKEAWATRQADLMTLREAEKLTWDQWAERVATARQAHEKRLTHIEVRAAKLRAQGSRRWDLLKLQSATATATQQLASFAGTSRRMFKLHKTLALAQAVISLPSAVLKAIDNGGGLPWGAIPGAITLAAGLAQIRAIKSSSFGGGGIGAASVSASGGGGGTSFGNTGNGPAIPSGPPRQQIQQAPRQVFITLQGDGAPSDGYIRDVLIPSINEAVGDGADIAIASR